MYENEYINKSIGGDVPHGFAFRCITHGKNTGNEYFCVNNEQYLHRVTHDNFKDIPGFSARKTIMFAKQVEGDLQASVYEDTVAELISKGYPTTEFRNHISKRKLYVRFLNCITTAPSSYDDVIKDVCVRYQDKMTYNVVRLESNNGKVVPVVRKEKYELFTSPFHDIEKICTVIDIKKDDYDFTRYIGYFSVWCSYREDLSKSYIIQYLSRNKIRFLEWVYTKTYEAKGSTSDVCSLILTNFSVVDQCKEIVVSFKRKDTPRYEKRHSEA